ncbi:uncharacterized protein V1477_011659 [Vespula maculifrons]|uniref:Uncharacterized protein n=1 Tax=Vespula maculifrons TaxID=7453 RepID=A0ABD2BZX3_VESMC
MLFQGPTLLSSLEADYPHFGFSLIPNKLLYISINSSLILARMASTKISKSTREIDLQSPPGVFSKSRKDAKISKSTRGDRFPKSSESAQISKSTREIDFQRPAKMRKFLSPLVEIDFQSPAKMRKFLSPLGR